MGEDPFSAKSFHLIYIYPGSSHLSEKEDPHIAISEIKLAPMVKRFAIRWYKMSEYTLIGNPA